MKCFQTENILAKESLCLRVVCPDKKKNQPGFYSSGRFPWFSEGDLQPGLPEGLRCSPISVKGFLGVTLIPYRTSRKEHFSSLLSTFPCWMLAVCRGWSDNAGCNVDTWFESKQCFIQVISWGK